MRFDWALVLAKMPEILAALGVTVYVWLASLVGAAVLGFAVAVARRYGPRWLDWILLGYVEVFRGTPFLMQLFLLYFGGPYAGLSLDALPAGLLALSVYGAAYFSEVFRAGFEAVPRGHVEAAECAGFSRGQIVRRILLPEMAMLVLPASVNLADQPFEGHRSLVGHHRAGTDADRQRARHGVLRLRRGAISARARLLGPG